MEQWVVDGRSIIQKRPNGSFIPGAYPNIATDPEWVDLSGLQAVYKKVLREGSGPTPKIYAEVSVNYKYIAKGIVVDTQGDAPMDFVLLPFLSSTALSKATRKFSFLAATTRSSSAGSVPSIDI